jgi:hypothetical protein
MGAAKSFTYQIIESERITVMNRQILGQGLRQRDPMSLPSCRRLPCLKLMQHEGALTPREVISLYSSCLPALVCVFGTRTQACAALNVGGWSERRSYAAARSGMTCLPS